MLPRTTEIRFESIWNITIWWFQFDAIVLNITKMEMVNMSKRQQHSGDENCQLKATSAWVFNERRGNPHATRHAVAGPKTTNSTQVQWSSCHIYSSNININWKWKRNKTYRGQKFLTWDRRKKCCEDKVLWRDQKHPLLNLVTEGENMTQINTPINQFKKVWVPC